MVSNFTFCMLWLQPVMRVLLCDLYWVYTCFRFSTMIDTTELWKLLKWIVNLNVRRRNRLVKAAVKHRKVITTQYSEIGEYFRGRYSKSFHRTFEKYLTPSQFLIKCFIVISRDFLYYNWANMETINSERMREKFLDDKICYIF